MLKRSRRGDGYARLSPAGANVLLWPEESGLLFVDLAFRARDLDTLRSALRRVPPSLLADTSRVVFRSPVVRWTLDVPEVPQDDPKRLVLPGFSEGPDKLAEHIAGFMAEHQMPLRTFGVFELPVGSPPTLAGDVTADDLALARAVELEGFLLQNGGLWTPRGYHYQLPSGVHASSFVRIADALRDPQASEALATWLHGALSSTTVLITDSGTLMPIIQQLDLVIARAASKLPIAFGGLSGILALDDYPLSKFELERRFERVEGTNILALLSVSSTGRTARVLEQTLARTAPSGQWHAECLVSRDSQAQAVPLKRMNGQQEPWLKIDPLEAVREAHDCELCKDPERARVVFIDPRTFSAMALPQPTLLMADTFAARRNGSLFGAYRQAAGHASPTVQLAGSERSRARAQPYGRPDGRRRLRFEPTALLRAASVGDLVAQRVTELESLRFADPSRDLIQNAVRRLREGRPTVAVCDREEIRVLASEFDPTGEAQARAVAMAKDRILVAVQAVCPEVSQVVVAGDGDLEEQLADHDRVLVFAAGLLTGVTLQHLVYELREAFSRIGNDPLMLGLVLHAHPYDSQAWASVRNSFGGRRDPYLLALWLTYLPEESPFALERDALLLLDPAELAELRPGAADLLNRRLAWLDTESAGSAATPPDSPLWFPRPVELGRTSIFGELDDRHAVGAVGAALHEAIDREISAGAPDWVQVDLPNAFRSFFDGLLHASLLRWTPPARVWWGRPNDCRALLEETKGRFTADSSDWQLLLPELLLAAAMGKVPDEGVNYLLKEADDQLDAAAWEDDVLDFVALGRVLVERLRPQWSMGQRPQDEVAALRQQLTDLHEAGVLSDGELASAQGRVSTLGPTK